MRSLLSLLLVVALVIPAPVAMASAAGATSQATTSGAAEERFVHVLAQTTTHYDTDRSHAGRAHNVELAAQLLDGAVIEPGATFSFNERVGDRTLERGFRRAPELSEGQLRMGVGGGVCQVASTLHVGALTTGLTVVERRAHSIVSRYIDAGLDATVVYGRSDFRVANPHAFPVQIRAEAHDGELTVRLMGTEAIEAATVETAVVRHLPMRTTEVTDASLASGTRVVEDEGRDGVVVRVRVVRPDGSSSEEIVRYQSQARVVRVAAH